MDKIFKGELNFGILVLVVDDLEIKPRWISSFDRSPLTIGSYVEFELFLNDYLGISFGIKFTLFWFSLTTSLMLAESNLDVMVIFSKTYSFWDGYFSGSHSEGS